MTAERMIKEYGEMKKELAVLRFQISHFEGMDEKDMIVSMLYGGHDETERVQTSNISDRTASIALNYRKQMARENDEWFDFLWDRYHYVKEEVEFFETTVGFLPEELGGIIMDMIEKMSWDTICEKYDICRTTVSNRKKEAVKQLNEAYRLRDIQTERFMLS